MRPFTRVACGDEKGPANSWHTDGKTVVDILQKEGLNADFEKELSVDEKGYLRRKGIAEPFVQ